MPSAAGDYPQREHVEGFCDKAIEARQEKVTAELGFAIREHSLHICADCIKKKCPHKPWGLFRARYSPTREYVKLNNQLSSHFNL
ncbi:MAG: hypothetical protein ABL911_07665 [Gallionella sp.]|nr:hypothetical protein [Gallionella sp.]